VKASFAISHTSDLTSDGFDEHAVSNEMSKKVINNLLNKNTPQFNEDILN
jgi:hypothetical protein